MPDDAPIAEYALLADSHTAALLHRAGSIDWWCPERFDRPSWFARLLDPSGGHWSITPVQDMITSRRYVPETFVVETEFTSAGGTVTLSDGLALRPGDRGHDIGVHVPGTIFRVVRGGSDRAGAVEMAFDLWARPDYARSPVSLTTAEDGDGPMLVLSGGGTAVFLRSSVDLGDIAADNHSGRLRATFAVDPDTPQWFTLSSDPSCAPAVDLLVETVAGWQSWNGLHDYGGWGRAHVRRSALVLQALTYGPTGALVAAPTTSLPESVGGGSNWDYRYAWLRDATFNVRALSHGACSDEADRYFDWMSEVCRAGDDPPVVVGLDGGRELHESTLDHLGGWRSSRPVRIGNGAWDQLQLDVPGEVLCAALLLRDDRSPFDDGRVRFLVEMADLVADRWREPDSGIWEGREGLRHYTSSKVMCWAALDRACRLAGELGPLARERLDRWARERDEIHRSVDAQSWHAGLGCYAGAFGSDHLDASVLLIPLTGFRPARDPRVLATIETIERELTDGGLVMRWTDADDEAFVMCSFWLAECHARAGNVERAIEVFDAVAGHANDVGLLSEEISRSTGELLGNFPQALSHSSLVTAAIAIDRALHDRSGP